MTQNPPASAPEKGPAKDPAKDPATAGARPPGAADAAQGMAVVARSQGQLVRRRFLRHRGALAGMLLLFFVVALAVTSIGAGPLPGWWDKDPTTTGNVVGNGDPTLSVLPDLLGGGGVHLGEHPFGQDNIGRDYFALTMRGTQVSLLIAIIVGLVATLVGTVIGAAAGYFRGWIEAVLMRVTDVVIAIPTLLIAGLIGVIIADKGVVLFALFLGLVAWTQIARLVRGEVLSLREKEFVEAARSVGTSSRRIIFKHILPNTVGIIIVAATLTIASAVLLESALSFVGLGVQPPDTSLGRLITEYRSALTVRPWLFYWPGLFIVAIALSVNFIGDGLRDAFDPRQTRVRD
ncbi:ABC transporter permease [Streptomyces radicis]|uniref:ABC transporter permease n=1 Tax=Streptomyces radicis TaxID=1750517 RepID=A0A3A9WEM0_9ACTN|nr:ABC transporter permease [Streptomyces radicis]RKN11488.1 ABC transporter permease [Streptomyces radicis]RKN26493.1 ABC transporter permease [Streptomyces radicis]